MRTSCPAPEARRSWVAAIAHNEGRRHWGRAKSHVLAELDDVHGAGDHADATVLRLALAEALDELPALDRELLELKYDHDQTQAAIAAFLGVPEGTVKIRLHRARNRLAALLEAPDG